MKKLQENTISSIDKLIILEEEKLKLLKQHKQGLLQFFEEESNKNFKNKINEKL